MKDYIFTSVPKYSRSTANGDIYKCPMCGNEFIMNYNAPYCDNCGAEFESMGGDTE